jgi:hypothetical protein
MIFEGNFSYGSAFYNTLTTRDDKKPMRKFPLNFMTAIMRCSLLFRRFLPGHTK